MIRKSIGTQFLLISKWESEVVDWLNSVTDENTYVTPDDIVCQACEKYIKGDHSSTRWIKQTVATIICMVKDCQSSATRRVSMVDVSNIVDILGDLVIPAKEDMARLCNPHYQVFYKVLNSPEACACCGEMPTFHKKYFS